VGQRGYFFPLINPNLSISACQKILNSGADFAAAFLGRRYLKGEEAPVLTASPGDQGRDEEAT
jgi:hypothetical protein